MQIRGPVTAVGERRTVDTRYGESELAELDLRLGADEQTLTLWGGWAETAAVLEPGIEVAAYGVETSEYRGREQYETAAGTRVVVEPSIIVDVTDVREWVQCPRQYYLGKLQGTPLAEPVVLGTIVHEVFGDLLRGQSLGPAVDRRVREAGLELGVLGADADAIRDRVREHAGAIRGWLQQGRLADDEWRSEQLLISDRYGLKGRADAVRGGTPVELKTGKNTNREPRFPDKVQATCYALLLGELNGAPPETATLLYSKNAAIDAEGDLSPAKEFSIGDGLLAYVLRLRNELAAMEARTGVPTGYEADAICEYCFEQDTCMAVAGRLDQESKAGQVGTAVPEPQQAYFDRLYAAVEKERRAVDREYAKLWEHSADERAAEDRALIDLEPTGTRRLADGRWELRASGTGAASKITTGDRVLASDGDPTGGEAELARVEALGAAGGEIVVTADEPVDLRRLDIYPSTIGEDRLLTALHDAVLTRDPEWKGPLLGDAAPTFGSTEETFVANNDRQDEAIRRAVTAEDYALIHGPPGTGKTYTLARLVQALVERGERVLVSAFTNRAVDNALAAIESRDCTDIVRLGTESGVREEFEEYRLDRAGDPEQRADALESASVVAATTASCGSRIARTQSFDVAVVDEAGQLTEPGTLAAAVLADRLVLVGDHEQLPPVVRAETDLERSLFERLIEAHPEAAVTLTEQYRMAQRIQAFPAREFYDDQLRPATPAVAGQSLGDLPDVDPSALPARLRDPVAYVDPGGSADGHTNPAEARAVAEIVAAYRKAGLAPGQIGVIAPYRAQVGAIEGRVPEGVAVDTVDRFQGSSKEAIVVSFVATDRLEGPIFDDHRRVNVALTRAKKALVLVGDRAALTTEDTYCRLVEWADR